MLLGQDRHKNRGYGVARAQQNVKCVRVMNACGQYLLGKKGPRVYTLVVTGHKNTVPSNTNIIQYGIVAACCTWCYSQLRKFDRFVRMKVGIKEVGECFQGLGVTTEGTRVRSMLREERWL